MLEVELFAAHHLASAEENLLGETDAFCNLEGEAAAWVTHSQTVEGPHGLGVEEHSAVDDAGHAVGQ